MVQGHHGGDVGVQQSVDQVVVIVDSRLVPGGDGPVGQQPGPRDGEAVMVDLEGRASVRVTVTVRTDGDCLFVGGLTSQQHACQGRICSDN